MKNNVIKHISKLLKIAGILLFTISVIGFYRVVYLTVTELDSHISMYEDLEEQLGFSWGTPIMDDGIERLIFGEVLEGGLMSQAGFKTDDIYDADVISVIDFTNMFIFHQNTQIVIPISRKGENLQIPFDVPTLNLRVDPYELHYPFTKYSK